MEELNGTAASDDGLISVVLDSTGRLQKLELAPDLLRRGRNGVILDTTALSERIIAVANAAYDDLAQKLSARNDEAIASIVNELQATTDEVERSLGDLGTSLIDSMRELGVDEPPPPMPRSHGQ